ncbi:MAG: hypothetical protein VCB81_03810, partial [Verrucomicrobiia bacterium]
MVEFGDVWGKFADMKNAGIVLCLSALLLIGCGGGNENLEISTTKIDQGKRATVATQTNATQTVTPPPTDLSTLKFVRRTNITTVVTSEATHVATNVVLVYYKDKAHFKKKQGFTGPTVMRSTNGIQSFISMKDGLRDGLCRFTYSSGKTKFRVNYLKGLKNGWALGSYETGKRRSRAYYTNNFRAGPSFTYHPNGMTNTVVVYSPKKLGTVLRRAAFDPSGKPLVGRTFPWQVGGNDANKQITSYRSQPARVLITVFGDPDRKTGNLWIYNKLRIRDMQARKIRHTVQFTVVNTVVTAVEV